jgi:hypothetical protein
MSFKSPDLNELKSIAASMGHDLDETLLQEIVAYLGPFSGAYKYLNNWPGLCSQI